MGCCCGPNHTCPDLVDTWTQPDGPASTRTDSGQGITYYQPGAQVAGNVLIPETAGGLFNLGAFTARQCSCCPRQNDAPGQVSFDWFVQFNAYEAVPGDGYFISLGFIAGPNPIGTSEMLGSIITAPGVLAGPADNTLLFTGINVTPWQYWAPGAIDAADGSLLRTVIGQTGLASYVDGVPCGFTPFSFFAGLPADPQDFFNVWMIVGGTVAGISSANVDNLRGGCASPIDETPWIPGPVTALSALGGSSAGGDFVLITGSGFRNATNVEFGGVDAGPVAFVSDTQVSVTSPPGAVGTVEVTVINTIGTSPLNPPNDNWIYT